jgi:hypothetical protein
MEFSGLGDLPLQICASVFYIYIFQTGWNSSVSIATRYGLDGQGLNPSGGEIFHTHPDTPWGPPSLLYNGYWVFPMGKAAGLWC